MEGFSRKLKDTTATAANKKLAEMKAKTEVLTCICQRPATVVFCKFCKRVFEGCVIRFCDVHGQPSKHRLFDHAFCIRKKCSSVCIVEVDNIEYMRQLVKHHC